MTENTKPEALRLSDLLTNGYTPSDGLLMTAAHELRRLHAVEQEAERLREAVKSLDVSESALIEERDRRDEVIDRMADAVLGVDRHEWTSHYDLEDAAQDVEDHMAHLQSEAERLRAENEALTVDAAHWQIVSNHWSKANFKFDKQNNIAGMTLVIDVTKEGRSALLIAREFDSIIAARASTPQAS